MATIFGIGVAINYSETFTDCIHNRKNRKEYQALTVSVSVLGSAIVKERANSDLFMSVLVISLTRIMALLLLWLP